MCIDRRLEPVKVLLRLADLPLICLIFSECRHVPQACAALKSGVWDRKTYMGSELYGETLAIVG